MNELKLKEMNEERIIYISPKGKAKKEGKRFS